MSMRVLLIEDNLLMQEQMRRMLGAIPGLRLVMVAGTQQQADDWLADHPSDWDLAIVDLFLGMGHGFNVLRRCRDRLPHQRVIVLSNYTRDPVRHYALKAGADEVFDKSFDMDALHEYLSLPSYTPAACRPIASQHATTISNQER